jgi:hypothetical protein
MSEHRLVLASALAGIALFAGTAEAADQRYQLHPVFVLCAAGPCPDWQVTDRRSGEKFYAVVDFSRIGTIRPASPHDLLAKARRARCQHPDGDGNYELLTVSSIVETTSAASGNRR